MSNLSTKYLKDYQVSNYLVDSISLTFQILDDTVVVSNVAKYYKNNDKHSKNHLTLDGSAKLITLLINNQTINSNRVTQENETLIITDLDDSFELTIVTEVNPWQNKACMGLYSTTGGLMTQCEPQGFRKITYYLDRPDVLATFTTTLIANRKAYPVLLSNGNKVDEQIIGENTSVSWHDPFKKPCYLFALVAGDFTKRTDTYTTKSGRQVTLEIYSSADNYKYTMHAVNSLKRAMKWDEDRFNLEYDLDIYMIVIANDFNMGAMENKGLNIFNPKYVLADTQTATDTDFIAIESVIGHEYFHNYTGNRVTCRDWFQLSLKEGLTVFRDNEFTADLHGHSIKRIDEVKSLRQHQFAEDAGPLAHSVRPESYIEINNFYTMTIYEKGQEVVRMYQTLLGRAGFNRGLASYLTINDGKAASCEDFCNAMFESNPDAAKLISQSQFMLWYSQAGTPELIVKSSYNKQTLDYIIEFEQKLPITPNQTDKKPMLIPVKFGLLDHVGREFSRITPSSGKYIIHDDGLVLLIDDLHVSFKFSGITSTPTPSILRHFSAPVKLEYAYTEPELLLLATHDSDEFNRYEAIALILTKQIKQTYAALLSKSTSPILSRELILALRLILENDNLNPEFRAICFSLPSYHDVLTELNSVEPKILVQAINHVGIQLGEALFDSFMNVYNLNLTLKYNFKDHSKRRLKNTALVYMLKALSVKTGNTNSLQLIETLSLGQYHNSDNMTDTIATLNAINDINIPLRTEILSSFYNQWQNNELVMNKWFAIHASSSLITIDQLNRLMVDKAFIATNPNKIYALLRTFTLNASCFNTEDGYSFIAQKIVLIDKFNPQVAGALVRGFSNINKLALRYKTLARNVLSQILENKPSSDVFELVTKIIEGIK